MSLIQQAFTKVLLDPATPLHHQWTIGDLPESYLQWIQQEGSWLFSSFKNN